MTSLSRTSWPFVIIAVTITYHFLCVIWMQIDMVRGGPGNFKLKLNNSFVEADTFTLRDGGILIQVSLLSVTLEQQSN
jgi:hypothetical protein